MKFLLALAVGLTGVAAYPGIKEERTPSFPKHAQGGCTTSKKCDTPYHVSDADVDYDAGNPTAAQKLSAKRTNCGAQGPCLFFDYDKQKVSTTGEHAYASPAADEIRGPCPGLNAAANHGYLPRSGVQGILETIGGLGKAYAMSADLGGFLAAYAIGFDGDVLSMKWSLGGPQPEGLLAKTGLFGKPQGISYSHNKYEGDSSIGRCDAYMNGGDAHSLSTMRFGYAYKAGMDDDRYTLDKFSREFAKNTVRSVHQNPYYSTGFFSTTLVSPAAYNFVINFMSNHSEEEKSGYLNGAMFKQFFAIEGDYPNFKWKKGQERIPENWYKRSPANKYTALSVFDDLIPEFLAYPKAFRFGGNTNGVGTYTGIDIANATGGVYNAATLFQGNNLACFFYEQQQQVIPDILRGGPNPEGLAFALMTKYLGKAFGSLACPKLEKYNDNSNTYPGHSYQPKAPKGKTPVNC